MSLKSRIQKIKSGDQDSSTVAINMIGNGICKPLSMIVSYIYVPIVMHYLGVEKYGVWATILSILSWISYFDIGIGNGLRNRLTEAIASQKQERGKKLVSSAYAMIAIIMIVAALVFIAVAQFINWHGVFGIGEIDEDLTQVVCVSVAFVATNFVLSICKNVLYALQRATFVSVMELCTQLMNLCGVFIVSQFINGNLFAMACVYGVSMITVNAVASIITYTRRKDVRPSIGKVEVKTGMELTSLGMQFFIIQICALVLFTTDNLIISRLYGAVDVTPYTSVNKLFNVISHAFTALLAPIWSSVTKAKTQNNFTWLNKLVNKLNILMVPFFCGAILLAIIFKPLAGWWLQMDLNYEHGLIALGAFYCILTMWCNTYAYIANGLELMKISMIVALVQAVVNIPLSLYFAQVWGMKNAGVLLGTVLSMFISAIITPVFVRKRIALGIKTNRQQ